MGYKAIFPIATAMTCDISMWTALRKSYEPIFAIAKAMSLSQSQSMYVNEP